MDLLIPLGGMRNLQLLILIAGKDIGSIHHSSLTTVLQLKRHFFAIILRFVFISIITPIL